MVYSVSNKGGLLRRNSFSVDARAVALVVCTLLWTQSSSTKGFQPVAVPLLPLRQQTPNTEPSLFGRTFSIDMVQNRGLEVRREGATPTGERKKSWKNETSFPPLFVCLNRLFSVFSCKYCFTRRSFSKRKEKKYQHDKNVERQN